MKGVSSDRILSACSRSGIVRLLNRVISTDSRASPTKRCWARQNDISIASLPYMTAKVITIGGAKILDQRVTYVGEAGREMYKGPEWLSRCGIG